MEEIWKDIEGYKGIYQVSSLGRVKSVGRMLSYKNHQDREQKETIMNPYKSRDYLGIVLYSCGKRKSFLVHRLVADTFIPNIENKEEVNHKNGNKHDNRAENLEWVTHSENNLHCYNVLNRKPSCLGKFGKEHPASKPVVRIDNITNEKNVFESLTDASVKNSISLKSISACCSGRQKTAGGYKWEFQKENADE
jgi:hypothetical protein